MGELATPHTRAGVSERTGPPAQMAIWAGLSADHFADAADCFSAGPLTARVVRCLVAAASPAGTRPQESFTEMPRQRHGRMGAERAGTASWTEHKSAIHRRVRSHLHWLSLDCAGGCLGIHDKPHDHPRHLLSLHAPTSPSSRHLILVSPEIGNAHALVRPSFRSARSAPPRACGWSFLRCSFSPFSFSNICFLCAPFGLLPL